MKVPFYAPRWVMDTGNSIYVETVGSYGPKFKVQFAVILFCGVSLRLEQPIVLRPVNISSYHYKSQRVFQHRDIMEYFQGEFI